MSVQCQIVPSWSLYLLSNLLLSLSWTVSALIEDLVCWACHFWVGLCFTFIFPSFVWKPLHIWFSMWNVGVVATYLNSLLSILAVIWNTDNKYHRDIWGAWGGLITLVLPLTNMTCPYWVKTTQPPGWYIRALSQVEFVFHTLPSQSGT